MTNPSTNAIAIITGAAGDIGRAIAAALTSDYHLALVDIDADALEGAGKTLATQGAKLSLHRCDLTCPADLTALKEQLAPLGRVSLLVNNAGAAAALSLQELTAEQLRQDLALNLEAATNIFKTFEDDLKQGGNLINIASVNGMAVFGHPAYSMAKAGLIHFTRLVATEYGKYGLRANTVAPGTVRTQAWNARAAANPKVFEEAAYWYPLGRVAEPEDVANAVAFLASPAANAITGVCLPVDCGLTSGPSPLPHTFTQSADYAPL
ncbi:SDR family oxidoreductase [Polycladidibacter hongkongensis]|uniref:SDR family oxidoreductase n=1 Tax=Polycladidibacter hongkongensis TaxID=1647556 RepID=UPI000AE882F9|nr:SDR family oxidoreductase [Pseudovibrio hongkongensis]